MANFFFFDEKSNTDKEMQSGDILLYSSDENTVHLSVAFHEESFWLTQRAMAELFEVESNTINYHLQEIYKSDELEEVSTTRKFRVVQKEGNSPSFNYVGKFKTCTQ